MKSELDSERKRKGAFDSNYRPIAVDMSVRQSITYDELIEMDTKLLWAIQDFVYRRRWIDKRMARLVSKYPYYDIGLVIWLMSVVGVYEIGKRHFWVVGMNLGAAFVMRKLIAAKRPVEVDNRLQPTTDIHPDSYGLPSLESYMSIVIVGHIFLRTGSWLFLPFGIFITLLVGFSRVYSRARFPHQIVASWGLGFVGLVGGIHYCEVMNGGFHGMHEFGHWTAFAVAVAVFLINVFMNMENNDSRLGGIPKEEYMRVLTGIMGSSAGEQGTDAAREANGDAAFMDATDGPSSSRSGGPSTPRGEAMRRAQADSMRDGLGRRRQPKRDSFHFLQRTLEARASGKDIQRVDSTTPRSEELNA